MTDFRKRNSILSFDHSGDLTRLRIGFRVKSVIALGSEVQKLILKTIAKILPKNMRNKQSGILYKKKIFLPSGKLSYSFFSYQNLLTNDYIKIYKNVVYIEINCAV